MNKKFEINRTKIKGGCQSGSKVVSHDSKSDLPVVAPFALTYCFAPSIYLFLHPYCSTRKVVVTQSLSVDC